MDHPVRDPLDRFREILWSEQGDEETGDERIDGDTDPSLPLTGEGDYLIKEAIEEVRSLLKGNGKAASNGDVRALLQEAIDMLPEE